MKKIFLICVFPLLILSCINKSINNQTDKQIAKINNDIKYSNENIAVLPYLKNESMGWIFAI